MKWYEIIAIIIAVLIVVINFGLYFFRKSKSKKNGKCATNCCDCPFSSGCSEK